MRRYAYLDAIRWMTVLLVIVYHVCYLFNGVGIFGGVPNARNLPLLDTISGTVYPWFMVLLFVVAGMCARFALVQQGESRVPAQSGAEAACAVNLGAVRAALGDGVSQYPHGRRGGYHPEALAVSDFGAVGHRAAVVCAAAVFVQHDFGADSQNRPERPPFPPRRTHPRHG